VKRVASTEERLDLFLVREFGESSRSAWVKAVRAKGVLVNGRPAKPGSLIRPGDTIEIYKPPRKERARTDVEVTLQLVYHDEWIVVANKPRGMPSVTLDSESDPPTVADNLATLFPECLEASPDKREAGLVHRLDTGTAGLILAAKSEETWKKLRAHLMEHRIEKEYLALVSGVLNEELDVSLYLSGEGKRVFVSRTERPGYSLINERVIPFRKLESGETIVKVVAPFARRHQVRATLSALGYPLVGDTLYGGVSGEDGFKLLASRLKFIHPVTGELLDFELRWEELQEPENESVGR
jgi:RluA family pseudouridine synthase